jgi:4-carboxymuconolactone decarboxylase
MTLDTDTGDSNLPDEVAFSKGYEQLFGGVPDSVRERWALQRRLGREELIAAVEAVRTLAILENRLGTKVQQLVHFGQLLVLNRAEPALVHARAAIRAGATLEELAGVAETALVTNGMPAFSLGMQIVGKLAD